jgi:antirestriction protein ArdC
MRGGAGTSYLRFLDVRKGERGSTVVYASKITCTGTDAETGEDCQETIPFLKSYTVFNVEQIEGLPAHFHAIAEATA